MSHPQPPSADHPASPHQPQPSQFQPQPDAQYQPNSQAQPESADQQQPGSQYQAQQPSQFQGQSAAQPSQYGTQPGTQQPAQYQPQQYPPQGPMGMLQLTIQGSVMTSNLIPPTVHLNGYPVTVKYGRNDIPVYAGPLHVDIHSRWLMTYGRAAIDFTVQPNQAVPVFYASPYHQFASTGSIGHTQVKRKGLGLLLGILGTILAVCLLMILIAALGS